VRSLLTTLAVVFALGVAMAQPNAYTSNISGNSISVVNTANNTVSGVISVPASPTGLAVTPDGAYVYVACQGANSVAVVSTAANAVVATIPVGTTPVQLAVTPNGTQVYVAIRGANQVAVIDTASKSVIGAIAVGNNPVAVAFNPNGSRAYVANLYGGNVSVIDTASRTVISTFSAASGANSVAVVPNGRIYVSNQYANSVTVHDTSGNLVTAIAGFSAPNWAAATPNGSRVFVTNGNSSSVGVIDTSSNTLMATVSTGSNPTSVAVSADGLNAYVTNEYAFTLSQVAVSNNTVMNTIQRVGVYPVAVATAPAAAPPQCTYSLSATSASFGAGGGTGSVNVTAPAGCGWSANSNSGFVQISAGASGSGNGTVSYTVGANSGSSGLSGTLTIAGQTFAITVAGVNCIYSLSSTSVSFAYTGGPGSVNVTAPVGCAWSAVSNAGWVSVTSGASGTGNGTVSFSANPNNSANSLSGTLTIAGQTVTATEAGAPCTSSLSATSGSFGSSGGSGSVGVTAPAGCAWTAVSNVAWTQVTAGANGSGNGTVTFSVNPNGGVNPISGTLNIAGHTYTVNEAGAGCSYSLSASIDSLSAGAQTGFVNIFTSASCTWTAMPDSTWLTLTAGSAGTGNGTASYAVTANPGAGSRTSHLIISGGLSFTVTQAGAACSYTINPASVNISSSGGSGNLAIVPSPASCPSLAGTSNVNWASVFVSANTASWSVTANSSSQARTGSFTIGPMSVPVTQGGAGASSTMSLSRSSLNFGTSGSLVTSAQAITVTFAGPGLAWTASSNQPNIAISPGSGSGNGTILVTASAGASGVVMVGAPGATNPSLQVQVNVTGVNPGTPVGSLDTPVDGTSAIAGAIAVTGWALDDIEVTKVDVWREPMGGEPAGLVYIGDAVFVSGARPDVEAARANMPLNYRAGWGYLLLTNFLPNNGGAAGLGNGMYRIHAVAHNKTGASVDLGGHTITVDNAHGSKPFGTIDTPAQGGTASGNAYLNFGWVLTQNPSIVPIDGSTIAVVVDGQIVGHPAYNNFRSDIASLFPGYMNSGGAVGIYYLDTSKLSNGVHTISWSVFDNAGHGDGVGSRYFNVFNGVAGSQAAPEDAIRPAAIARQRGRVHSVDIEELGRVELPLDAVGGYQVVNGERAPLPVGSSLKQGVFYWQPGPGFLGNYEFVFEREDGGEVPARVKIRAKTYRQ